MGLSRQLSVLDVPAVYGNCFRHGFRLRHQSEICLRSPAKLSAALRAPSKTGLVDFHRERAPFAHRAGEAGFLILIKFR